MREFIVAVSLFIVTWIVLVVLAMFVLRWRLHHANRVSPHTRSNAPLIWLYSPSRPARIHRRLRSNMRGLNLAVPRPDDTDQSPGLSISALRIELEDQAVALDHQVVAASHQPRTARRAALGRLDSQVNDFEAIATRLTTLHRSSNTPASGWEVKPATPAALEFISRRVELLEAAHDEVSSIERASGLGEPQVLEPQVNPQLNPQQLPAPPR